MKYLTPSMHYIAAAVMFFVSVLIAVDVIGRVGFDSPLHGAPEIIANTIVFIAFMQLPYAVRAGAMLRVEVLERHLPVTARRYLASFHNIAGAALFGAVVYASWAPMVRAIEEGEYYGEGAMRVVAWPVRTVIVVASAVAVIEFSLAAYRALRGLEVNDSSLHSDDLNGSESGL